LTALDCKVIVGFRKRKVKTVVKTESIREQIEIEIEIERELKRNSRGTKDRLD